MPTAEALAQPIDDASAAYILETRRAFEDLRQISSELAGLLVLAAAGSKEAVPDHPALAAAAALHREASDAIGRARPTIRAQSHHQHLLDASRNLARALAAANRLHDVDPVLIPLRAAYRALEQAARALPGFELVAFDRACCRIHLPNEVKPAQ